MMRPERVLQAVERFYQIPLGSIESPCRQKHITKARGVAVKVLRDYNKLSYPEIGDLINKHHTSIMYLYRKQSQVQWRLYLCLLYQRYFK